MKKNLFTLGIIFSFFAFNATAKDCECKLSVYKDMNNKTVNKLLFNQRVDKRGSCKNTCKTVYNTKKSTAFSSAKAKGLCGKVELELQYKKNTQRHYRGDRFKVNLHSTKSDYSCPYGGELKGGRCILSAPNNAKEVAVSGGSCQYQSCPNGQWVDDTTKKCTMGTQANLPSDIPNAKLGKYFIWKGSLYKYAGSPKTVKLTKGSVPGSQKLMIVGGSQGKQCSYLAEEKLTCN